MSIPTTTGSIRLPQSTHRPHFDWHRRSVFYEVMVRSFSDSNGDGIGDFAGLTSRLDYLKWLGIDAVWVPPFYDSPLRDGGYDVSDYRSVLPAFGTIDDVREFIEQAHSRDMRVLIDLPINHTSDAHPWFRASESDPDGPYGDFYVWRDNDEGYPKVRIIFTDAETSNWAWSETRGQYYFHRFFSHQPDLNFESPSVHRAVRDVFEFWLDLGVDGIRLDAIPYLYESEDGTGESEPGTHQFIRDLRAWMDANHPGRVLIAEANQWPAETAKYFGSEDEPECHMAFDFPSMPRIFSALKSGDARDLARVLALEVAAPAGSAWGVFLRNHDELTLEMLDDDDRAKMWQWYAPNPRMRINVGIRRRLAPLLDGNRAKLELANVLMFSLAGSPFVYYGDEIGMGDNIWLDDRDASRTPMHWTSENNAGFSSAPAGQLYLPVIANDRYNPAEVNVEKAIEDEGSLLHFMRGLIARRHEHPVLGTGSLTVLETSDPAVLAFARTGESDAILCVFSFSDEPVTARISVFGAPGIVISEHAIGEQLAIGDDNTVEVTLPPFAYRWYR